MLVASAMKAVVVEGDHNAKRCGGGQTAEQEPEEGSPPYRETCRRREIFENHTFFNEFALLRDKVAMKF